jgi:formate hydrogenlyase transcriptional activator
MQHITVPIKPSLPSECGSVSNPPPGNDALSNPDRLVSLLITRFAHLSDHTSLEISAMLQDVVDCFGFDGCGLVSLAGDSGTVYYRNNNGASWAPPRLTMEGLFPWSMKTLLNGNIVRFAGRSDLPAEAEPDRIQYEAAGILACLAIPIEFGTAIEFAFVAHGTGRSRAWQNDTISHLRLIGKILVMYLHQGTGDQQPYSQLQRLTCEASARMLDSDPGIIEEVINATLEQARKVLDLDRFGVATLSADQRELKVTHFSYGRDIAPVPEKVDVAPLFPWAKAKLMRGETVQFSSPDELPPEAAVDRQSWQALGVQSNLSLPIRVAGSIRYLLLGSRVRSPRLLDQSLLPTLRLLGELLAAALVRLGSETAQREAQAEVERLREKLQSDAEHLQVELVNSQRHEEIVGQSSALARTLALTEQVAPTDSTVLISGETGTGKELVAQAIHKLSARRNRQMVKVNCASLPAALVESELFGREKGAYTGALTRQAGRFELADSGTIFLDEVAEMSLELQAKLLRVLQEGQFERLGSGKTIQVDVRVIAATNRNLAEEVKKGNFREDLYYRLNVFQIVVPPLRERIEDIPLLVWSFVHEFGEKMGKKINKISKQDMAALQSYPWPGNVRELRNVLEHAVIVSSGDRLQVRLPERSGSASGGVRTLEEYEIMHIKDALRLTGWRIKGEGGAASLLGLNPSTLYSRMQKLGISNRPGKDEISP